MAAADHPDALNLLGVLLVAQGRPDEALPAYRRAVELRPGYAEVCSNLGNALLALGRFEEAAAAYRQAIELRPDLPEVYANLGGALQAQGKLDDAVTAFRRAIDLRRDFPEAHFWLGSLRLGQGGRDDAVLIAETPDDYVARAVALAHDPERTQLLRERLRDMTTASPLCDARGFATAIEAAYREMWRRWCASVPSPIFVPRISG